MDLCDVSVVLRDVCVMCVQYLCGVCVMFVWRVCDACVMMV